VSLARATIAYLAFHELGVSLAEVARQLGVSRQSLWERMDEGRKAASLLDSIPEIT
jgi:biotin operon repressor